MSTRRFGRYSFELTSEDKLIFASEGITKQRLVEYYERIADVMLRHTRDRPLVMRRFPDGIDQQGFYQKQISDYFPNWIPRVKVEKAGGTQELVVANSRAVLAYLANQACVTPHLWLSRTDRIDHPDQMIVDLDPPSGAFNIVRRAAVLVRDLLTELGLTPFLKTTGSKGLHVVVPLDRSADFDTVRAFARDVADLLARRHADRLTTEHRIAKRGSRLYLDVNRNAYAQTAVAPYALRARPGAPVATPIDWDELSDPDLHAQTWTIRNIFERLRKRDDPWKDLRRRARSLTRPRKKLDALREKLGAR